MDNTPDYTLIYIGPFGFSGSTLLDIALAQSPDCFSVGEVFQIAEWVENDHLCTCRNPISGCDFWPNILAEADIANLKSPSGIGRDDFRTRNIRDHQLYTNAHWELIDRVAAQTGAKIIIDGSKHLWRLKLLAQARPEKVRFLHLTRGPTAVMQSAAKPKARPAVSDTAMTEPKSAIRTLAKWSLTNRAARIFAQRNQIARLPVVYDTLTNAPKDTLGEICNWLDIPFDPTMLTLKTPDLHNIAGSRWRLSKDSFAIKPTSDTQRDSLLAKAANQFAGASR